MSKFNFNISKTPGGDGYQISNEPKAKSTIGSVIASAGKKMLGLPVKLLKNVLPEGPPGGKIDTKVGKSLAERKVSIPEGTQWKKEQDPLGKVAREHGIDLAQTQGKQDKPAIPPKPQKLVDEFNARQASKPKPPELPPKPGKEETIAPKSILKKDPNQSKQTPGRMKALKNQAGFQKVKVGFGVSSEEGDIKRVKRDAKSSVEVKHTKTHNIPLRETRRDKEINILQKHGFDPDTMDPKEAYDTAQRLLKEEDDKKAAEKQKAASGGSEAEMSKVDKANLERDALAAPIQTALDKLAKYEIAKEKGMVLYEKGKSVVTTKEEREEYRVEDSDIEATKNMLLLKYEKELGSKEAAVQKLDQEIQARLEKYNTDEFTNRTWTPYMQKPIDE